MRISVSRQKTCLITAIALVFQLSAAPPAWAESTATVEGHEVAIRGPLRTASSAYIPAIDAAELTTQSPKTIELLGSGVLLIDFGKVAFGNLELTPPPDCQAKLVVRFGEKLQEGVIDRQPPGTVRYSEVEVEVTPGKTMVIAPPADQKNTQQSGKLGRYGNKTPPAVLTPPEWGVVTPFRWVEIEGLGDDLQASQVARRAAFPRHWDDKAASFECSNDTLNRVWQLCRYSIKATLFAGIYVDGDRERIPYEADAYLNQLSDYYVNGHPAAARQTFDWLMKHPTWPTEWAPHMVFMAHADWMHNGDVEWIAERYESLKTKTLIDRCGESGLVHSNELQIEWNDIIDWPPAERDGFVRTEVNTVVNAFHLAAIEKMAELAEAVGADADSDRYHQHADRAKRVFRAQLFDKEHGLYRDGLDVEHHSQHANFFPLAFGLVPDEHSQGITHWLEERGMRCSVYAAQYLLEALFENGAGEAALEMMIAPGERSWRHMLDSDATITWEAWNEKAKTNLDWNHAWGAAPANLLPRYVLGVQPLTPGWDRAIIRPIPSGLEFARGVAPTPHGPVSVDWRRSGKLFRLELELPEGMTASVLAPATSDSKGVFVNGQLAEAELKEGYWVLKEDLIGVSLVEVR